MPVTCPSLVDSSQKPPRTSLRTSNTRHGYRGQFQQFGRYVGHYVGLSVHDVGGTGGAGAQKPLVAGVVFNVEPILELSDKKIHMRLEDTVLLTETGAENLTAGVPAELDPLYALIRQRGVNSTSIAQRTR